MTGSCSIEGCTRPSTGRSMCNAHWERRRRYGDPLAGGPFRESKPPKRCSVDGCDAYAKARGWCATHYQRWKTTGDPGIAELLRTPGDPSLSEKPCRACGEVKPMSDFHNEPRNRDRKASWCKECVAPGNRDRAIQRKYGITSADYDAMAAAQGGNCACCGESAKLVIDHCHKSGKVRALLCDRCNRLLGVADDQPDLLRAALAFLEVHT